MEIIFLASVQQIYDTVQNRSDILVKRENGEILAIADYVKLDSRESIYEKIANIRAVDEKVVIELTAR